MKHVLLPAMVAGSIAGVALGSASAAYAAPTGPVSASETVNALQARGLHVILIKTGTAPLDECAVTSVRPGQTFTRTDSGVPGAGSSIVTTVTAKTVYVDVDC
ncbi:MAG TPA: hypothetical protein VGP27_17935 [Mycobacterium sp.]|jgi:hypothetical protein|nr:hypothetical protein [Mycobacterium sp.]